MRLANLLALAALIPVALGPLEAEAQPRIGSVDLELGSNQQEVLSSLQNYQVLRVGGSGNWAVSLRTEERYEFLGSVQFAEDRLIAVSRDWMPEEQDDAMAVVGAAINALTGVAESTDEPCELVPGQETQLEPGVSSIEIWCGIHGVSIKVIQYPDGDGVTISESWRLHGEGR